MRIVEVGPRDGLQNEAISIPTEAKAAFVARLAEAGLQEIEATSFVSPKWVPQLGDAESLWPLIPRGPTYSALVPNPKGLDRALGVGVRKIALFTAASDAFTEQNIGMSVERSLEVFAEVVAALPPEVKVRGYVSTAFVCPYAGPVAPARVREVADRLAALGIAEISVGDTIGAAVPRDVTRLAGHLNGLPDLFWHFHDTWGTALANVQAALDSGVGVGFDASAAGLGGCPYAPGAAGNLATEDLVYLLEKEGFRTGIDPERLAQASLPVLELLGRPVTARAQAATLAASSPEACR